MRGFSDVNAKPLSPGHMYAEILRKDLYAFIHRSFLELNAGKAFEPNWHL